MTETTVRIVPGAPPPTPISKSQKKKRKSVKPKGDESNSPVVVQDPTAASPLEKSSSNTDVKVGLVAPTLTSVPSGSADDMPQSAVDDDAGYKPSPVVDLVYKRLKAIHKKIGRISTYASTPLDKLDDGQRRALKTLPSLEAVQKELEEVKKAIEVHEAEQVQELTLKRIEAERAEKQKLKDAVTAAEAHQIGKASDLLSYLRFQSLRSAGHPPAATLDLDEPEHNAVFVTSEILLGDDCDHKQAILSGFMSGQGEYEGVSYIRLHEIVRSYLNPPRLPTPIPEEPIEIPQELEASAVIETDDATAGAPGTLSVANSFHFMQKSELEGSGLEDSTEWVETVDAVGAEGSSTQDEPAVTNNGNDAVDEAQVPASGSIDWAEEGDSDLPSLVGLHAKFGTSGTATPAESSPPPASQPEGKSPVSPPVNGNGAVPQEDDDGFTQAGRGGRGRRGGDAAFKPNFRGDRGDRGDRGGYRGVPRGRGGDRGFRGGDRGFRGGFRGDRGRGGGDGDWRGEGRGRGRGRGGFHEAPRGAPPSAS